MQQCHVSWKTRIPSWASPQFRQVPPVIFLPEQPKRVFRALRSVPILVWAIVVLQLTWTLLATYANPNGRGPDETQHMDLSVLVATGDAFPWPYTAPQSSGVLLNYSTLRTGRIGAPLRLADDMPFERRADRESLADIHARPYHPVAYSQMIQHPPG